MGYEAESVVVWPCVGGLFTITSGRCNELRSALLKRNDFTEFRYRRRFLEARPEGQESPGQFMVRLKNYFTKWVELSLVEKSLDGVVELMVREQFTNACSKDLSVYLNERSPKTLDGLVILAEQYLMAHDKKLSSKDVKARQGDTRGFGRGKSPESFRAVVRCRCGGEGHQAAECVSRMSEEHRRDGQQGRRVPCYRCGAFRHEAKNCRSTLRNQQTSRSRPTGGKPSGPSQRVECAVRVRKELPQARLMEDDDLLELKSREKTEILNGGCMDSEMTEGMPFVIGKVGDKCVEMLRDTVLAAMES